LRSHLSHLFKREHDTLSRRRSQSDAGDVENLGRDFFRFKICPCTSPSKHIMGIDDRPKLSLTPPRVHCRCLRGRSKAADGHHTIARYGVRGPPIDPGCAADRSSIVFHSTRHTTNTLLHGRVPDQVMDAITGHDDTSVSSHYGETELAVMAAAIETYIPVA
jgi:hypothetical protein